MAKRGEFTPHIAEKMRKFLGRESDQIELRLIPYLQYTMVNSQRVEPSKVNDNERAILSKLRVAGHIEGGASGLAVTREYWDFMCDILFDAYLNHEEI
jgi:hypothetical protein